MVIDQLADYARHECARALPEAVAHHAKRAVIDWFSALFPGIGEAPGPQLMRAHAAEIGHGRSSLPGQRQSAFAATAAWINGSISHAVEFDDIFRDAVYHPGCPTISAALAVAEAQGASGADFLRAVTVGYEISTRIGVAVQPSHYRFFHTTGTVGCFGSAAATAALLAPAQPEVMRHALATAASLAAGLQQAFRSDAMTKALHAGHAGWVGVTAGQGAASGITGAIDILEGEAGFGKALSDGAQWARATEALGERYNIQSITQKNHGCCGHTFAAIDAMLDIRQREALSASQIAAIRVETYQTALDVTGNFEPRTAFEAKFSLPYVVAHALLHGAVRLNAFEPGRLEDADIRSLMARTQLVADPQLSAGFPAQRAARIVVTLHDGRVIEQFAPCRKGDPEAPLSDADLEDKFLELASPVLGDAPARQLLAQLWQLERLSLADLRLGQL
jgi:2-methylcitrate dehydratase PrpD